MDSSFSEYSDSLNPADISEELDVNLLKRNLAQELNQTSPVKVAKKHFSDADYMQVYLRLRPFSTVELKEGENKNCVTIEDEHVLVVNGPKESNNFKNSKRGTTKNQHRFFFSHIFNDRASQQDIFNITLLPKLKAFLSGQNCLLFTFGVTNSGKTHTIQGTAQDAGILPRSFDVLFNSLDDRILPGYTIKPKMFCDVEKLSENRQELEQLTKEMLFKSQPDDSDVTTTSESGLGSNVSMDSLQSQALRSSQNSSSSQGSEAKSEDAFLDENRVRDGTILPLEGQGERIRFSIWVSFAEVYNEQIFDLLIAPPKKKKNVRRPVLQLKDDNRGLPYIRGLKEVCVHSADEAFKVLALGKRNLHFAATRLNHNSSRSHCIFTIKMIQVAESKDPKYARTSMLSFCDLAGTERYTKTHSFGDRIKEAGNINTSMLTLGRCMATLRDNQRRHQKQIVPFRDSKLTRLFQSFFSGQGKASMIVNINQCASVFDETLHALKYSAIAKEVVVVQEEPAKVAPPPKKKARGVVSEVLAQPTLSRATVGWASPATLAKALKEDEKEEEVPNTATDEQDEDQCPNCDELLKENLELQKLVKDQTRSLQTQEVILRKELCSEFTQQLIELENAYKKQLETTQLLQEDRTEQRCNLLARSLKKQRKRKRIDEDELHSVTEDQKSEQILDLQKKLESAKDQVEMLENELLQAHNDREELQQKATKLTFENADLEKRLKDAEEQILQQEES